MKKIVVFCCFFIFIMCLSNYSEAAMSINKYCNKCTIYTQCTYKPINAQFHALCCDVCGSQVIIDERRGLKQESHIWDENAVCRKCEYSVVECTHTGTTWKYIPNSDGQTHRVICDNCNASISEREPCYPNQRECKNCGVRKTASFDIPKKVYYIDKDGLKDVNSMEQVNQIDINLENTVGTPYFYWTMSTMGENQYNSASNNSSISASSDRTIKFWYNGNGFNASLTSNPEKLSGEVVIKITMKVDDIETSQTIRIIKSGIPKSNCTIYFKNNRVGLKGDDEKFLYLLIKTNYNDFSDDEVRKIREEVLNEFPFYIVKNSEIELRSLDEGILKIGDYEVREVTNGYINGYWAKVKVNPEKLGQAKVKYRLTTEYKYMNHETVEKEREGVFFIDVVEKVTESESNWDGNRISSTTEGVSSGSNGGYNISNSGNSDDEENNSENRNTGSSGGLAIVGVMGLLIVAFIGSKMLNHR